MSLIGSTQESEYNGEMRWRDPAEMKSSYNDVRIFGILLF